jgi:hypothetical protein
VESVPLTIDPEGRYELRIEKGDSTGAYQPTVHDIFFNGHHVVADALPDFVSYRIVEPSDTNTIRVDVGGDAGDFVKVALLVQPSPSFTVFGPATFIKQSAGLEFFPIDPRLFVMA